MVDKLSKIHNKKLNININNYKNDIIFYIKNNILYLKIKNTIIYRKLRYSVRKIGYKKQKDIIHIVDNIIIIPVMKKYFNYEIKIIN